MKSNTYIFGGPVVPPYLDAVCVVCDILMSDEYEVLVGRLRANMDRLTDGLRSLGVVVQGGRVPIVSVLVGDEADTLNAGQFLFEQGYYVQSVTFPAVPYHAGVLRIQVNANHRTESIDGLIDAVKALQAVVPLPTPDPRRVA
jgi:7-keto-8-aminopelargonate synthetase-like enzyme